MSRPFAYASPVDVLAHLSVATFTGSSRPNASEVGDLLLTASDELDAALTDAKYSVPVATGATAASELLRRYAAIGGAMYSANSHPSGKNSNFLPFLERRWNAILGSIRSGEISLPEIARDSSTSLPRFGGEPAISGATPFFTRDAVEDV